MSKKITITIGIAARNEQQNIGNLLNSILLQENTNYILKEILVISDESTDKTVSVVTKYVKSLPIKIAENSVRLGKSGTMRKIFAKNTSEVLVMLDADVILSSPSTLRNMLAPFTNSRVGMVCGQMIPVSSKSFVGHAVSSSFQAYSRAARVISSGNNVFTVKGGAMAIRNTILTKINLPTTVHCDDSFIYLFTRSQKYLYRYVHTAGFIFKLPTSVNDQIKQYHRYTSSSDFLTSYFGTQATRAFQMPKAVFIKSLLIQFFHTPISCLAIFIINLYAKLLVLQGRHEISSLWSAPSSTKQAII